MSKIKLTFKHIFSLIVVFFGSFLNAQEDADTNDPKASGNKEEAAKEAAAKPEDTAEAKAKPEPVKPEKK